MPIKYGRKVFVHASSQSSHGWLIVLQDSTALFLPFSSESSQLNIQQGDTVLLLPVVAENRNTQDWLQIFRNGKILISTTIEQSAIIAEPLKEMMYQCSDRISTLTAIEFKVTQYLGSGASNKSIANSLKRTEGTIKVHVKNITRKLGVRNRTQVALAFLNYTRRLDPSGDTTPQELAMAEAE